MDQQSAMTMVAEPACKAISPVDMAGRHRVCSREQTLARITPYFVAELRDGSVLPSR